MTSYVVKNERGEYLRLNMDGAYSWGPKRRERMVWMSDVRAHGEHLAWRAPKESK